MTSKTLTQGLRVNVTPATEEALQRIAEREERSLAAIVRLALREYLERDAQSQEV